MCGTTTVSGLTTAAGIWATAGVGMALGAGIYFIGISSGFLVVILQVLLHRIRFLSAEPTRGYMKLATDQFENVSKELQERLGEDHVRLLSLKVSKGKENTKIELELLYPPGYEKQALQCLGQGPEDSFYIWLSAFWAPAAAVGPEDCVRKHQPFRLFCATLRGAGELEKWGTSHFLIFFDNGRMRKKTNSLHKTIWEKK